MSIRSRKQDTGSARSRDSSESRLGRSATTRSSGCSARPSGRKGGHRLYSEADVLRLQELIRLRDLLGLSLDELVELAEAEDARGVLCSAGSTNPDDEERLQIILAEARPLVERQLELVRARSPRSSSLPAKLEEKLEQIRACREELEARAAVRARRRGYVAAQG